MGVSHTILESTSSMDTIFDTYVFEWGFLSGLGLCGKRSVSCVCVCVGGGGGCGVFGGLTWERVGTALSEHV